MSATSVRHPLLVEARDEVQQARIHLCAAIAKVEQLREAPDASGDDVIAADRLARQVVVTLMAIPPAYRKALR